MDQLTKHQNLAFFTIWVTYCITYFLRKPLGIVKPEIGAVMHLSNGELGWMDLCLMLPYAVVQIGGSSFWDTNNPRYVIVLCLSTASISMLFFSISPIFFLICLFLMINGTAQAPIWPAATKVLSSWYPEHRQSSVFGAISTAPYVGALVGTGMAIYIQDHYTWRLAFIPSFALGILVSIIVFFFLKSPRELKISVPGEVQSSSSKPTDVSSLNQFMKIPGVVQVSIAVFCLKFVRYTMYMWLPMYLIDYLGYTKVQGGLFSTMFDIGGIVGGPLLGIFIDKYLTRRPLYGIYQLTILGTVTYILLVFVAHWGSFYVSILLLIAGAANCGPDSLLTGSVTMTIGEKFGSGSGAGVTSLVNGIGSLGAIIEGPIIGLISQFIGWTGVMVSMILLCLAATISTLRAHVVVSSEEKRIPLSTTRKREDEEELL